MFGYERSLYILENPNTGRIKIGISHAPKDRALALRYKYKFRGGRFFHTDLIVYPTKTEKKIHDILYKYSVGEEWFCYPYEKGKWIVNNLFYTARANLFNQIIKTLLGGSTKRENMFLNNKEYRKKITNDAWYWRLRAKGCNDVWKLLIS